MMLSTVLSGEQVASDTRAAGDKVPVLYIGGYSRSGSTLLLRLLGRLSNVIAVGELWDVWERSFKQNQLCGCGKPFSDCEFWSEVVVKAFGTVSPAYIERMLRLRERVHGPRSLPMLILPPLRTPAYRAALSEYGDVLSRLYRAIYEVSGGKLIIDSSKVAQYARVLQETPGVDLRIVHLVRDSRATSFSWQRKKIRPEIHWETSYMRRYSVTRSSLEWDLYNLMLEGLSGVQDRYLRLRYEDLVRDPDGGLSQVMALEGLEFGDLNIVAADGTVNVDLDHTVSGNPMRFQQGQLKIRPDDEWKQSMSTRKKAVVTALTWPLLVKYGYVGTEQEG